jgi:glycosyltransferase involved in cell wall biosynthesis
MRQDDDGEMDGTAKEMLIDVTRLLVRALQGRLPTGVDRVCVSYVRRYGARSRAFVFKAGLGRVLETTPSQEIFELLVNPVGGSFRRAARIIAPSLVRVSNGNESAGRVLFNVSHSGLDDLGYAEWLLRKKVRPVFMVHDLIPITHPEFCRDGESGRHALRMRAILKTGAGIVTYSKATFDELRKFAKASGCAMPPAVVAPLGYGPFDGSEISDTRYPLSDPYFVMLGTIEPRKNHWMMLQVWRRIVERMGCSAPKLVVIGQRGWECENVVDLLERCTQLRGIVIELSDCCDAELSCWLRRARALIFPSFEEGYGLPLLEALSLGVPVIAGNLPVFREFAGDIPDYVDPLDGPAWINHIEDYSLPDSPLRAAQLGRLPGFAAPAWQDHFEAVDKLLEQIEN